MQYLGYNEQFFEAVIDCLKRNYDWMSHKTTEFIGQWLNPIINYKWNNDFPVEKYPYKFGMVLINDDQKVVGFLGLIYSRQFIDGVQKVVVNPSTWAIDDDYRMEIFKCIGIIQQTADIVVDYSARQSLVEIFTKMFKYQNIDHLGCFLLPIPYLGRKCLRLMKIDKAEQIEREHIKKIFVDHCEYNVFCVEVSKQDKKEYIFYKIEKKATVLKGVLPMDGIYVLFVSDTKFFTKYAKEIIWKLQRLEKAALKTDSRFFGINEDKRKGLRTYQINRLVYGAETLCEQPSSIYTELSILLDE